MTKPLTALLCIGIVLTASGLPFTGFVPSFCDGYWFVWPYILLSLSCVVAAALGLVHPTAQRRAFWAAEASCVVLPVAAWFAMSRWPGGDDGPGMAWLLVVRPISIIALVTACAIAGLVAWRRVATGRTVQ